MVLLLTMPVTTPAWAGITFDAADDIVDCNNHASTQGLGPLTVSAWVMATSGGEADQGLLVTTSEAAALSGGWRFGVNASVDTEIEFIKDGATDLRHVTTGTLFSLNTWTHVAVTWDGSDTAANARIYFNGAEAASYATTTNAVTQVAEDASNEVTIGARLDGASGGR